MKIQPIRRVALVIFGVIALTGPGCGDRTKPGAQAPVTPEMERQAEASSRYMMEQMQPKKAQKK